MRKASKGKFNKAKKEAIGEREIFKEKTNYEVCVFCFVLFFSVLWAFPPLTEFSTLNLLNRRQIISGRFLEALVL